MGPPGGRRGWLRLAKLRELRVSHSASRWVLRGLRRGGASRGRTAHEPPPLQLRLLLAVVAVGAVLASFASSDSTGHVRLR